MSSCATPLETTPGRTATEQLLISNAADEAASRLSLPMVEGRKVFLDAGSFSGEGAAYARASLRGALIRQGAILEDDRAAAEIVVEARLGALGIDQVNRVLGVPQMTLPMSSNLTLATIPELTLYSRRDRVGIAEMTVLVYEPRTGRLLAALTPLVGDVRIRSHKLLMILSWGQRQLQPGQTEETPSWRQF
ncbi:DUF6655 family protein [Caulobacter mirabilis]|uniref:Uncharacterized protein n=1 Tax=Caulobacter mirabilis TaxID=69666 RepID=A0A2D2B1Y7_9CAUL|nr:DUF6655 family protein [Caulobacter mirabilis]ATQ44279.1 hypothetical protein CSW64_18750 [Caulobacter mirabilis]